MADTKQNSPAPAKAAADEPKPAAPVKPEAASSPEAAPKVQAVEAVKPAAADSPKPAPKPKAAPARARKKKTARKAAAPRPAAKPAKPQPKTRPSAPAAAINKGTSKMTDTTKIAADNAKQAADTARQTADKAQAMFADVSDRSKAAMEKSTKMVEQMTDLTKGNVEALIASSRIAAKGGENLVREAAEFGRKRFETATATMKSFASAKSPTEVFQLQSDYARGAFDSMIAESSKLTEAWLKIANDVAEPITSRYAVAADKIKKVAA